jgi:hypothetical protein
MHARLFLPLPRLQSEQVMAQAVPTKKAAQRNTDSSVYRTFTTTSYTLEIVDASPVYMTTMFLEVFAQLSLILHIAAFNAGTSPSGVPSIHAA